MYPSVLIYCRVVTLVICKRHWPGDIHQKPYFNGRIDRDIWLWNKEPVYVDSPGGSLMPLDFGLVWVYKASEATGGHID